MLPSEREVLAYDIRRDAEYTRMRIVEYDGAVADSPTKPAVLRSARCFALWCEDASDELLRNPQADVSQVREAWRREAVAGDVRFIPYGDYATLMTLGLGGVAVMFVAGGFISGSIGPWIIAGGSGILALACLGYRRWTPSRLAVGPDAQHSALASASARQILNRESQQLRRRYQAKAARKRVH